MAEAHELMCFYREQMQHENGLMLARLNAMISSQAFLVIAYATSMASANGRWDATFTLMLPPMLAFLGFILAFHARWSIVAARAAAMRWRQRLVQTLDEHPELDPWRDEADGDEVTWGRKAGELFARRAPIMFMGGWIWFLLLPFVLRRWG